MRKTVQEGSETAKNGFKNEQFVINIFNEWKHNKLAQKWLIIMGYKISEIECVQAIKITGNFKSDIQVQISIIIKVKEKIDCQNISIKLVSNPQGFNQIDKRWIDKYIELWNIPQNISTLLKYYTGELLPYKKPVRDERRMFIDEFTQVEQNILLDFFKENKTLILTDTLKGRGQFSAEWMLVIYKKHSLIESVLKPINEVLNYYAKDNIEITKNGNLKIGKITMQRKGGDGGRATAKMLQFKLNPMDLFNF